MKTTFTKCRLALVAALLIGTMFAFSPLTSQAQELTFSFTTTLAGETCDAQQFGLREDALQGMDDYDVPEPPAQPGAGFVSYLAMFNGPPSLPNRWRRDIRPTVSLMSDRTELWQYDFQSDAIGSEVTLEIDSMGSVPVPYELYFFGPGVYYEPILVPDSITFTITANKMVFFWELRLTDAVETVPATWGGIKSLYR